ncbi:hypothetical protein EYF80_053645 [Liparis tanakae]|uniref:Uncharacterized protein n=1 Tax=Liparis tanakae TaxID=230148 RepID=A0A4Z2F5Z3_9TELE|nr:hypothetical protein EYF80_053645 [Liparis tanakae]
MQQRAIRNVPKAVAKVKTFLFLLRNLKSSDRPHVGLTELSMPRVSNMMKNTIAQKVEPGNVEIASGSVLCLLTLGSGSAAARCQQVFKPLEVDVEVRPDAVHGTRESDASDQQHKEDHAEVEDEDHDDQAQGQLPAGQAQVVDTPTLMEMQHTPPARRRRGYDTLGNINR